MAKNKANTGGSAVKTNALRTLDAKKIPHRIYTYEAPDGFLDGVSVAEALGLEAGRVLKTLVTQSAPGEYCVCVIPVARELDLKKAARHFGVKRIEMLPAKDITKVTGYIKGGCSPVGMKKLFPTAVDRSARSYETVVVSAGRVGVQMELSPQDLCLLTAASFGDLAAEEKEMP